MAWDIELEFVNNVAVEFKNEIELASGLEF